jgi:predicted kinase
MFPAAPELDRCAGHLVILSGSPGCGKTTTAESLAHLGGAVAKVHVHSDDFWGYIKHGHIDPWLPESDAQNRMVMAIAADVAAHYARAGYIVFLDGVIRPAFVPIFAALQVPIHYIVLRVGVAAAVARCSARGGDSLTDPGVVAALHSQFADLAAFEPHALAVDGLDRDAVCRAVIAAVTAGSHRLQGVSGQGGHIPQAREASRIEAADRP